MLCMLEIAMVVMGFRILYLKQIWVGGQVVHQPWTFFVAAPLILQLPMVMIVGFLIGFSEGMEAVRTGRSLDAEKYQQKYFWVDIAIPTAGAALAGVILAFGLKDPMDLDSTHEDELVSLRLVQDRKQDVFAARPKAKRGSFFSDEPDLHDAPPPPPPFENNRFPSGHDDPDEYR